MATLTQTYNGLYYANLTMGSQNSFISAVIDPDSSVSVITNLGWTATRPAPPALAPLPPWNATNVPSPNATYDWTNSTTSQGLDTLIFRNGSMASVGYFVADNMCTWPTVQTSSKVCMVQYFLAAQWNVERYSPFNGVLGLGPGSQLYGQSFLNTLNKIRPTYNAQWAVSSGPFPSPLNNTVVHLGGYLGNLLAPTTNAQDTTFGMNFFNISNGTINPNSLWMLNIVNLQYSGVSIADSITAPAAYFDYRTDAVLFPQSVYAALTSAMQRQVQNYKVVPALPALSCQPGRGCTFSNLCSVLLDVLGDIRVQFDTNLWYTVPLRTYAVDMPGLTCMLKIDKQGNDNTNKPLNYITLGLPMMKAYYIVFDQSLSMVGLGKAINSYGTVSKQ